MSVYKHHGRWRYDFMKNGVKHKKGGFRTKLEAQMAEAHARKNLKRINTDFIGLCESRLEDLEARSGDEYFRYNKRLIENRILEWAELEEIQRIDVQRYLNKVAKRSHWEANRQLRCIRRLFNHGIELGWIEKNPASGIKFFSIDKAEKYIPPQEDIQKILNVAKPQDRDYLLMIMLTLARVREINNLEWADVREDYLILKTRKSKNSNVAKRPIPLTKLLKEVVSRIPKTGKYVFMNKRTGTRYDYRKKLLKGLCKKAGVKPFGFHSLRHYGASKLASEGVPLTDIQRVLGHQRATTTDLYLQSLNKRLINAVELVWEIPPSTPPKGKNENGDN
jgi:integrase